MAPAPTPMSPDVARAIVDSYQRVAGEVTSATGKTILRTWLMARGRQPDRWGNFLSPSDPSRRWHFKTNVINEQRKSGGGWHNIWSASIIDQALFIVERAVTNLGDNAPLCRIHEGDCKDNPDISRACSTHTLLAKVQGARAKKKGAQVKAAARGAQQVLDRKAADLGLKILAREEPVAIAMNLRGESLPDADYTRLRARAAELRAEILAGRGVRDQDVADVDHPPIVPVYRPITYRWVDDSTGVPYTVEIVNGGKRSAKISIGSAGALGVDPLTHNISVSDGGEGDGLLTGTIRWDDEDAEYHGSLFLVSANQRRAGAGSRLLAIWCRLMKGYGTPKFVAEAVGPEGEAFLKALEKRGSIRLSGRQGSYWLAECLDRGARAEEPAPRRDNPRRRRKNPLSDSTVAGQAGPISNIGTYVAQAEALFGITTRDRIYGCGTMGCAVPLVTRKKGAAVLKLTTDELERNGIEAIAALPKKDRVGFASLLSPVEVFAYRLPWDPDGQRNKIWAYVRGDVTPLREDEPGDYFSGLSSVMRRLNAARGDKGAYDEEVAALSASFPPFRDVATTLAAASRAGMLLFDLSPYSNVGRRADGGIVMFDVRGWRA